MPRHSTSSSARFNSERNSMPELRPLSPSSDESSNDARSASIPRTPGRYERSPSPFAKLVIAEPPRKRRYEELEDQLKSLQATTATLQAHTATLETTISKLVERIRFLEKAHDTPPSLKVKSRPINSLHTLQAKKRDIEAELAKLRRDYDDTPKRGRLTSSKELCTFCDISYHYSDTCTRVQNGIARVEIARQKQMCFKCLRDHGTDYQCNPRACRYCGQRDHHCSLCSHPDKVEETFNRAHTVFAKRLERINADIKLIGEDAELRGEGGRNDPSR